MQFTAKVCILDWSNIILCESHEMSFVHPKHAFMPCWIAQFNIVLLFIVSGNVELNPGPMKKCLKCKKMMSTRSNNCECGYLLCYVAARVLHFSAFINTVL